MDPNLMPLMKEAISLYSTASGQVLSASEQHAARLLLFGLLECEVTEKTVGVQPDLRYGGSDAQKQEHTQAQWWRQQQQQHQIHTVVKRRTAYSLKIGSIRQNPWLSARNALSGARDSAVVSAALSAAGGAGGAETLLSPILAVVSLLMASHFLMRTEVRYEDACVLHAAWLASEWIDGKYLADLGSIISELDRLQGAYGIEGPAGDVVRKALPALQAIGSLERKGDSDWYALNETVLIADFKTTH